MKYYVVNDFDFVETVEKDVKDRITIEYISNWKFISKIRQQTGFGNYFVDTNLKLIEENTYNVIVLYCDITENTNIVEYNIPIVLGVFDDAIKSNKIVSKLKHGIVNKVKQDFNEEGIDFNPYDWLKVYSKITVKIEKLILKGD